MTARTAEALRQLESLMRGTRRRAHILVVDQKTTISFATGAESNGENTSNLGPEPVAEAWERIRAAGGRPPTPAELGAKGNGEIAGVTWNSRHLLVTGTSAAHALAMAARQSQQHGEAVMRHLASLAGCADGSAVSELQAVLFGEPLSGKAIDELDRALANG